jgi:hypothetical protein
MLFRLAAVLRNLLVMGGPLTPPGNFWHAPTLPCMTDMLVENLAGPLGGGGSLRLDALAMGACESERDVQPEYA